MELDFIKDKGLRVEKELQDWQLRLEKFLDELNEIEELKKKV